MAEENFKEKRKAPRYKADGEVRLRFSGKDNELVGQLVDISRIGIFVMFDSVDESCAYEMCDMELSTLVYDETLFIKGKSVVVRVAPVGLGMYINEIAEEYRLNFVKFMGFVQKPENAV